jgi:ABC-type transporter Mla maintaining outer membrane lipid asymmetry ATPase subunit MlaF
MTASLGCPAGGSGTGKSTTLRLMAGLLAPDRGEVVVQGVPRRGLASDDTSVVKCVPDTPTGAQSPTPTSVTHA